LRTSGGTSYKVLILPGSRFIPLETFERVRALARGGATVVAFKELPSDVAGLADLDRRRQSFAKLLTEAAPRPPDANGIGVTSIGRGAILHGRDLDLLLARAGVARETLVDRGLELVRRRHGNGRVYFIVNSSGREVRDWIPLEDRAMSSVVFDPMSGRRGDARTRQSAAGGAEVFLALGAGESVLVQTGARVGEAFRVLETAGPAIEVVGPWTVRFAAGGPELPAARTLDELGSWTRLEGDDVKRFSGTAVYTARFPRPAAPAAAWQLDLGRVHDSARIRLNGRDLGTAIGPSFRVTVDAGSLDGENRLEVHVTNLAANRISALDRAGVRWKNFYNVNFPARFPQNRGADGLFTAAAWEPLDSGLLGPVTLTPLREPL
jgi:hypothetical protein